MTERAPAAPAGKVQKFPQTDLGKLLALLGASGLIYAAALGPVLSSVGGVKSADDARAALARRAKALQQQNRRSAAHLQAEERTLKSDLQREQSLRSELAMLKSEAPPPASSVAIASVKLPAVHTTTGASGVP